MAAVTARVEGLKELRRALLDLGIDVKDFKDVNTKVGNYVGAIAAQNSPRQSGQLAASWRPGSAKAQATISFGNARVPYANAVHWGTGARPGRRGPHNIRRNPFAVNAAHDTETVWVQWFLDELQRLTDQAMEKAS